MRGNKTELAIKHELVMRNGTGPWQIVIHDAALELGARQCDVKKAAQGLLDLQEICSFGKTQNHWADDSTWLLPDMPANNP